MLYALLVDNIKRNKFKHEVGWEWSRLVGEKEILQLTDDQNCE